MTLQRFRTLTANVDALHLRHAMIAALMLEVPLDREGYRRFYGRVVGSLESRESLETLDQPAPEIGLPAIRPEFVSA